ncbi:MAG: hypothetical protein WC996_09500 [Peptostreptococcales bacterium]
MGPQYIAKELGRRGLKLPSVYKAERDGVEPKRVLKRPDAAWHTSVVSGILANREYNSGDYTNQIAKLKIGDIATLEGPYGSFWGEKTADAVSPIVMLAGGIGITPIISIIRNQIEKQSSRRIVLVWGLSTHEDLLMLHELQAMRDSNDSFSYHIILSKKQVDEFDSGQITKKYLQKIGVNTLYPEADFFICGPAPMMESMKKILKDNQVDSTRIHIEEFSF